MRRGIAVITAFLLLGAIVNVAVAWCIALRSDVEAIATDAWFEAIPNKWRSPLTSQITDATADDLAPLERLGFQPRIEPPFDRIERPFEFAWRIEMLEVIETGLLHRQLLETPFMKRRSRGLLVQPPRGRTPIYLRAEVGWPLKSLFSERIRPNPRPLNAPFVHHSGIVVFDDSGRHVLPFGVLPTGFAGNTIIYGLPAWVLFTGAVITCRTIRRRRGLCGKCAYPIGVSPVCTECGAILPRPLSPRRGAGL
jgi:hypothetical protein